jgi:hypothetical protein
MWVLSLKQSLAANEDFQHILRVLNTNVDGKKKDNVCFDINQRYWQALC